MSRFFTAVLFVTTVILCGHGAYAKTFGGYVIEGVDAKSARTAKEILEGHLKGSFNLDDIQKVMGLVYDTNLFTDIEVYFEDKGDETQIVFKLNPVRHVRSVNFVGNRTYSNSDLTNELGFGETDGYTDERIRTAVENVKKFYNLNGFLNAKVEGSLTRIDAGPDLTLTLSISEGEPCLIKSIEFKSVNSNLNRDLMRAFAKTTGKVFSQTKLNETQNDINEYLFGEKYYSSTVLAPEIAYAPEKTSVGLTYIINDPYIFALNFEGNESYNEARIRKELKLEPSNRLSSAPLDDLTERLLRFYKKQGFANATVKFKENLFTQDYVRRVTFTISEGAKVKIKDIVIDGSFSRAEKYYKTLIFDHSSDLISSKYYNTDDMDVAVKNLVIELQNQGFIGAKVIGTRTDFDKKHESAIVHVSLDEGPQTFVEKIVFNGIHTVSNADLEATINLQQNGPLHLGALEDASTHIVDLYRSKGYLDAQVLNSGKSVITYSPDNTKATLSFDVAEGPLITVSSVVIEGNSFTKEFVVRRELQFHPGEVLTPDKVAYSEQRLQRLAIFSSVDIHTLEDDPQQGNRTVLVRVVERPPGIFKSGIGVNNDFGFNIKGFVGAAYRNLFGTGRGINSRFEINDKTQYNFIENDLSLGYTEPFVFDTLNTARLNLSKSTKIFSIADQQPLGTFIYAVSSAQGDLIVERDLTRNLKLVYDIYGLAHTITFEINGQTPPQTPGSTIPPPKLPLTLDISTTGPTLIYDHRDDPFNPTRGDITSLSFEYSSPWMGSSASVDFSKTILGYTRYTPVKGIVWANELKGGYIGNLSSDPNSSIPAIKAFILGGRSTIRGFDPISESIPLPSEFPIQYPFYAFPSYEWFVLVKEELRIPIYGNFGLALFYDGGQVYFPGYAPHFMWRDSVGLGLRYNTPVGPVSLEYGYKLEVDTNRGGNIASGIAPIVESPGQLLFSIGVF